MTSNWPWKPTSYNTQTCGAYAVTKRECSALGLFYLAYFHDKQISDGPHKDAAAAKQACVDHSQGAA